MRLKFLFLFAVMFVSLLVSVPASLGASVTSASQVDGIHVKLSSTEVAIDVWPHTSSGGWVYINFTAKSWSAATDLLWGFDSDMCKVSKFQVWNPHNVVTPGNSSIAEYYYAPLDKVFKYPSPEGNMTVRASDYKFILQIPRGKTETQLDGRSKEAQRFYANEGAVLFYHLVNGSWVLTENRDFDTCNNRGENRWYTWHTTALVEWDAWKESAFQKSKFRFNGMTDWATVPVQLNGQKSYYARFWLDVLPRLPEESGGLGEYFVGLKQSADSVVDSLRFKKAQLLDPWWNSTWTYKVKLTIDATKIDADLTDFPVTVFFDSGNMNWTNVQDDLDDFRFVDSSETTLLDAELESYTVDTDAVIHVRIPSVDDTTDTDFYCYFGNPTASSAWDAEGVWDSNFVMIQHMTDNPDTSHIKDSTSNNNDGTKKAANEPILTSAGQIDGAQDFDGTDDIITIADANSLDLTQFSLSMWFISHDDQVGNIVQPLIKHDANYMFCWDHAASQYKQSWNFMATDASFPTAKYTTALVKNTLYFLEGTYNGISLIAYLNGIQDTLTLTSKTPAVSHLNFVLGRVAGVTPFDGILEEVRISNIPRPPAWVKAEYYSGLDGLLGYGSSSELTPPTIGEFQAPAIVYPNKATYLNVTASYDLGATSIKNLSWLLSGGVKVNWDEATKVFSEVSDPSNYASLDATGSAYSLVNASAYKVCYRLVFSSTYPEGYKTGDATVNTDDGITASETQTDWFLFSQPPVSTSIFGSAFLMAMVVLSVGLVYFGRLRRRLKYSQF